MACVKTVALAVLLLLVHATQGADEGGSKKNLAGTWKRTLSENSVTFTFKGDTLHTVVTANGNRMEVEADYGVSKDGVLFGRISKVKKEGDGGPSEGDLFSFRFKTNNQTLTLSELKTPHESSEAKELLEGEYQRQKGKGK